MILQCIAKTLAEITEFPAEVTGRIGRSIILRNAYICSVYLAAHSGKINKDLESFRFISEH